MKAVCISLDFELRWGVRHIYRDDFSKYQLQLDGAKNAAILLCDYFEKREINSSWATVGALSLQNWDNFFSKVSRNELDTWSNFVAKDEEFLSKNEKYYFAPDIVQHLHLSNYASLASHTFTHLFCCEPHVSEAIFLADGKLFNRVFQENYGYQPQAIVFPRNQQNYTKRLADLGIGSYRAIEVGDRVEANTITGNTLIKKGARFISSINPLLAHSSAFYEDYSRASIFLRLNLPRFAWRLHLARIKNELNKLKDGECFHIWWHPHNLGLDTNMKLKRVDEVMQVILKYRDQGEIEILTMEQLSDFSKNDQMKADRREIKI